MVSNPDGVNPAQGIPQRYLHVRLPSGEEHVVALTGADITIGKSEKSSISIDDSAISATHAVFRFAGGEWIVADLGSRNGVFVNHNRVAGSIVLRPGDEIHIGHSLFAFRTTADDGRAKPKAKSGGKAKKAKARNQATWIKVAGAILAKVIGPIATLLIGLALSGHFLLSCGPHKDPDTNTAPTHPQIVMAHASRSLAETAGHPAAKHHGHRTR